MQTNRNHDLAGKTSQGASVGSRSSVSESIPAGSSKEGFVMTKHTPGPWMVASDDVSVIVAQGVEVNESQADEVSICICGTHSCANDDFDAVMADARLIAASPTLFDYVSRKAGDGDIEARAIISQINA